MSHAHIYNLIDIQSSIIHIYIWIYICIHQYSTSLTEKAVKKLGLELQGCQYGFTMVLIKQASDFRHNPERKYPILI